MTFSAPVRDLAFMLETVGHGCMLRNAFSDLDSDTVNAVLEAAASFVEHELAPLNRKGDVEGALCEDGRVTAPAGFRHAYSQFVAQGWNSLSAKPEHGGQGLSKAMELAVFEMIHASNMAFGLCPMLTLGAIEALTLHGTERQKRLVLPRLVLGEWTGAMCLTEPQAGSDLSALTTVARSNGKGGWLLSGTKIFITWGDHDLADNICHLIIARTPGAPPGVKGVSLFLATKFHVKDDGTLGPRNRFRAASIEGKLGIHGSPTCVMLYEEAEAELIGELGQGLAQMFVMMNAARLQVGVQGVAVAERAFQQALAFCLERQQGVPVWGGEGIYGHPDVRRTLVLMKAKIDAARGICLMTGVLADVARSADSEEKRIAARARQELLTPIAKAWSTDMGVEAASAGVQVHGGMGFIEETGAAQHYRDARVAPIYEGTNGVQAIDLVCRKVRINKGRTIYELCDEMTLTARLLAEHPELTPVGRRLTTAITALERATDWLISAEHSAALASATPFLKLAGDVIGGWIMGLQALAGANSDDRWLQGKANLARFYASQVLNLASGIADGICEQPSDIENTTAAALLG